MQRGRTLRSKTIDWEYLEMATYQDQACPNVPEDMRSLQLLSYPVGTYLGKRRAGREAFAPIPASGSLHAFNVSPLDLLATRLLSAARQVASGCRRLEKCAPAFWIDDASDKNANFSNSYPAIWIIDRTWIGGEGSCDAPSGGSETGPPCLTKPPPALGFPAFPIPTVRHT